MSALFAWIAMSLVVAVPIIAVLAIILFVVLNIPNIIDSLKPVEVDTELFKKPVSAKHEPTPTKAFSSWSEATGRPRFDEDCRKLSEDYERFLEEYGRAPESREEVARINWERLKEGKSTFELDIYE